MILDPSFGGGAFLHAAVNLLKSLNVDEPERLVYGVDIDAATKKYTLSLLESGIPPSNLIVDDFLTATLQCRLPKFGSVVGNPPYVRHHRMSDTSIRASQELLKAVGFGLSATASSWAYFTLLSASCLRPDGAMALILPGTLVHADYAKSLISQLERCFGFLHMIQVQERIFLGTNEESVILLARHRGGSCTTRYSHVRRANEIEGELKKLTDEEVVPQIDYKLNLLSARTLNVWRRLQNHSATRRFNDIAKIRIGIVTGANKFFIRSWNDEIFTSPNVMGRPIITSKSYLSGPDFGLSQFDTLKLLRKPCRLLQISSSGLESDTLLKCELDSARLSKLPDRSHCRRRQTWFVLEDKEPPDVFLPYMSSESPTMTMNSANVLCTNAIHRVFVTAIDRISLTVASYTSLFALESEIFGRHYGGGVLKLEPSAVTKMTIPVVVPPALSTRMLHGSITTTNSIRNDVDRDLLGAAYALTSDDVIALREGVAILRNSRQRRLHMTNVGQ